MKTPKPQAEKMKYTVQYQECGGQPASDYPQPDLATAEKAACDLAQGLLPGGTVSLHDGEPTDSGWSACITKHGFALKVHGDGGSAERIRRTLASNAR